MMRRFATISVRPLAIRQARVLGVCALRDKRSEHGEVLSYNLTRSFSAVHIQDDREWEREFAARCAGIRSDLGYDDSATQLRSLIKSGLLNFTDLQNNPKRFFHAHRILAAHSPQLGPGFWIRFTVQYNLFAGTILALASDEQVGVLDEIQKAGELGCFGLTERLAGVNSGLVVNTIADWDATNQCFVLNSPDEGSYKNWISQGLCADKAVVLADLRVGGESVGAHGFLMDFRVGGEVVDGITLGDMGGKTTGNDLDNAWIAFHDVKLPHSALLSRYASVVDDRYVPVVEGVKPFQMIGQRLFTGRVAVAQAAITFTNSLFEQTKEYSDNKKCWAPQGEPSLSHIPQLRALYREADERMGAVEHFVGLCEAQLSDSLLKGQMPSVGLVDAIAVAKVRAVETSIELCFRLKQEVGSYALMEDSGFTHMDFLQCCKFAEGDSRILMQKMARDRVRKFTKTKETAGSDLESQQCAALVKAMAEQKDRGGDAQEAWDEQWEAVYELAETMMVRVTNEWLERIPLPEALPEAA